SNSASQGLASLVSAFALTGSAGAFGVTDISVCVNPGTDRNVCDTEVDSSCMGVVLFVHSYDSRSHFQVAPPALKRTLFDWSMNSMASNGNRSAVYFVLDAFVRAAASFA